VARDLGGLDLYGWVFSVFMLAGILGTVAAGRTADRSGPARPFLVATTLFALGLALAAVTPSMFVLVLARATQGLGAGAVEAVSYVAIGRALPERLRARMFALLSSAWVLPGLLGPALSALITHLFGWRWVFAGLIPLVLLAASLTLPALYRLGPVAGATELDGAQAREHRLRDALPAALGAGLLLAGLSASSLLAAVALVCAALAIGLPALRRLLPDGTLRARAGLPVVVLSRGLVTFAFFGGDAFVTLAVISVFHHSTTLASVIVTAPALTWAAGAWLQLRLGRRWQGRESVAGGMLLVVAGIAGVLVSLQAGLGVALAIPAWTLAGFGMGFAYSPISLMTISEAPRDAAGWASASLNLSDVLGTALGAGFGGAALVIGAHYGWALRTSVCAAFGIAGVGAVVALAVAGRLPRTSRPFVQEAGTSLSSDGVGAHLRGQGAL